MTDYEKTLQMIEEYENSGGGDFAGFKSHIGTLAAGGATPFLGLNHWKSSDKPVMEDFNHDNEKIDAAVRELWSQKADDTDVVKRTGDQQIAGSKTFSRQLICSQGIRIEGDSVPLRCASSANGSAYFQCNANGELSAFVQDASNTAGAGFLLSQGTSDAAYASISNVATFRPNIDNSTNLGEAATRWKNVYAGTGTIQTSDERQKKDISALTGIKGFFMKLRPVKHRFIDGSTGRYHHGLIAQEVEAAMQNSGLSDIDFAGLIKSPSKDKDGEYIYGLRYSEFIPMIIKMVQDQQTEIDALKAGQVPLDR